VTAPPAEGARVQWAELPAPVRAAIERVCGSPVVSARTQPGGFSPGVAARVVCAEGTRRFIKAVSAEANPDSPGMHRQEARVLATLDPLITAGHLPVPRLLGSVEAGPWVALVMADVEGRHPALPWRDDDIGLVLAALDRLAEALTPAPARVPSIADKYRTEFTGWRILSRAPNGSRLDPWSRRHIEELADLETTWEGHASGDTLLHTDVRADNLLITDSGVVVVDWPHACRGAAFVEPVFMAPSVAMQGGPGPSELLARSRAGRTASRAALAATVCAVAGYFTESALRPPPPGLPTVRAFQAAQGDVARRWLADLI
jgi:aminoglycoside phosphotransferase (APT) family kinase protein